MSSKEFVRQVIGKKDWYQESDGHFSFPLSIQSLTRLLGISESFKVEAAMSKAFADADAAVRVNMGGEQLFLVDAVAELKDKYGFSLTIWTVGDIDWQTAKATLSHLYSEASKVDFYCTDDDKIEAIPDLLKKYDCSELLIVDDKQSNLAAARSLTQEHGYKLMTYHFNIDDNSADQIAFVDWLKKLCEEGNCGQETLLLLDMDGVLLDTDKVLLNAAAEKIAELLKST